MLILDEDGAEQWRIEGYLPNDEFRAELEMGLARLDAMKKRWAEAQVRYEHISATYPRTAHAPDALYWRYVSHYNHTRDHTILGEAARVIRERYPDSQAAVKASIWAG